MKSHRKKCRNINEFFIEHFKDDPKFADEFLEFSLKEYQKDGDEKTLLIALKQIAIAKGGFTKLANETGLARENLYKALSENGDPRISTFKLILEKLGYALSIKKIRKRS